MLPSFEGYDVVATLGDYTSSLVTNSSSVAGATVTNALNTLAAAIAAIPAAPVSTVFGRIGAVVAVAGDYTSTLITNASNVPGAFVTQALNTLLARADSEQIWSPRRSWLMFWRATPAAILFGATYSGTSFTGTATARSFATTNYMSRQPRIGLLTASPAGSILGVRHPTGNDVPFCGSTGYYAVFRFGVAAVSASMRYFVGMRGGNASPTNVDPATIANIIGVGTNGNANLQLYTNDASGSAVPVDLGPSFPALTVNAFYELYLHAVAGGAAIDYELRRLDVPQSVSGTLSADLPVAGTFVEPYQWCTNNTDAVAVEIAHGGIEAAVPYY